MGTQHEIYQGPWHSREMIRENVPCGICITTRYLDEDGNLLRQDIRIEVKKGVLEASAQTCNSLQESS